METGVCDMMTMMTFMLSKVMKLDKHNYSQWKLDMELRLAVWKDKKNNIIDCHVDGVWIAADEPTWIALRAYLEEQGLLVNDLGQLDIFIGIHISRDRANRRIYLSQEEYIWKILKAFGMEDCKPIATPMANSTFPTHGTKCTDDEIKLYQRLIGYLLYIMHGTRPNLAYLLFASLSMLQHPCNITGLRLSGYCDI